MVDNDPTTEPATTPPVTDEITTQATDAAATETESVETSAPAAESAPAEAQAAAPEPAAEPPAAEPVATEATPPAPAAEPAPEASTAVVPPADAPTPTAPAPVTEPPSAPAPDVPDAVVTAAAAAPATETPAAPSAETPAAPAAEAVSAPASDAPEAVVTAEPAAPAAETPAAPAAAEAPATETAAAETAAPATAEAPAASATETAAPATETAATESAEAPAPAGAGAAAPVAPGTPAAPPAMGGFASGEIVTGVVTAVNKNEMELDLGEGRVGLIGARHWTSGLLIDLTGEVKVGDSVEGAVLARADVKQRIVMSRVWARQMKAWSLVEDAQKNNTNLTVRVTSVVKGGLSVDANGLRGFMPASLVDNQPVADLDPYVGQEIEARVMESDKTKGRLLLSRKSALRASARAQAKEALGTMEVGSEHDGKVVQITDFGAFVDVNGIRGLVHRSELGWRRFREPSEAVTVGQDVKVRVVKVQASRNRLGLSMRLGDDPLKTIKVGERREGQVSRLVDFGAFVQLEGGIEGLVHVSELAEYRVFQPEEVVMPGETVQVKVLKIDKRKRTIDLSIREALVPDLAPLVADTDDAAGDSEEE